MRLGEQDHDELSGSWVLYVYSARPWRYTTVLYMHASFLYAVWKYVGFQKRRKQNLMVEGRRWRAPGEGKGSSGVQYVEPGFASDVMISKHC